MHALAKLFMHFSFGLQTQQRSTWLGY